MPTVLIAIVFPPALEPVMTSILKALPNVSEIGTTLSAGINGCLASFKSNIPAAEKVARTPFMASANCPRAKINSISETIWQSFRITALLFLICRVSSLRTSITSCFSASTSSIRSLFRRTEIIGYIKSVCPVEERS